VLALVAILAALAPSSAPPDDGGAGDALAPAFESHAAGDGAECGRRAQAALQAGGLDVETTARAWLLRGRCFVLTGDLDRAERSFAVALRLRRDLAVDPPAGAQTDGGAEPAFAAARAALPPPGESLDGGAAALAADAVEVRLRKDDLLLVKAARLVRGGEEVARFPLDAARSRHRVSGVEAAGLEAVFLDKHENELLRVAVEGLIDGHAPRVFTVEGSGGQGGGQRAGGAAPGVLTTLGATALGAGIVGIVASGIALAALGPEAGDEATAWVVGVGASTGLFLVGAGLIVVDQGGVLDGVPDGRLAGGGDGLNDRRGDRSGKGGAAAPPAAPPAAVAIGG
jgi:hypothetical protein